MKQLARLTSITRLGNTENTPVPSARCSGVSSGKLMPTCSACSATSRENSAAAVDPSGMSMVRNRSAASMSASE